MVGPSNTIVTAVIFGDLAMNPVEIKAQGGNVWNELGRHSGACDKIILLPGLRNGLLNDLVQAFSEEKVSALDRMDDDATRLWLYQVISDVIGEWTPGGSPKSPKDKDKTDHHHHRPKNTDAILEAICALPGVAMLRHKKGAGRDYYASVVGGQVSVHVEGTYGLLIDATSTHPRHLDLVRAEVAAILACNR